MPYEAVELCKGIKLILFFCLFQSFLLIWKCEASCISQESLQSDMNCLFFLLKVTSR